MDLAARPAGGRGLEGREHRLGAAAIKMRVLRRRGDDGGEVEEFAAGFVVEMQMHAIRTELLQRFEKRHLVARAA